MLLNGNRCSQSLKLFKYIHVPISTLTSTFKCYTFLNMLTISSVASLAAVTDSTRTRGTTVVNQDREEI